jgi:hypothetical protein
MTCKTHPDAPHGFVRNASLSEDRYVCECEFWEEPKMNERIRQLLNEATVGLEPDLSTHTTITHNELAKFAELVKDDYSKRHAQLWLKRIDDAVKAEREAIEKRVMELDEPIATRVNVINKAIRTGEKNE